MERMRIGHLHSGADVEDFRRRENHLSSGCARSGFLVQRTASMSVPSTPLCIQSVFAGQINRNLLSIPVKIEFENKNVETLSLLDSGAGGEFIDQNYAKTLKLPLSDLEKPIPAVNVDGTLNKKGTIKQYVSKPEYGNLWTKTNHSIVGNWTGKAESVTRIPMAPEV